MSPHRDPSTELDEVARLLEPLARAETEVPSADAVYWRARARLAVEQSDRRRQVVLLPMRWFHVAAGGFATALAALASFWPLLVPASPGAGLLAAPILVVTFATGAYFLTEATR